MKKLKTAVRSSLSRIDKIVGIVLLLLAVTTFFIMVIPANTDLIEGRPFLYMDEQITFDNVQKILHPANDSWLWSVADANEHRYGRIFFYTAAAASYFPEKFFGDKGLIIATRMYLATTLLLSYILFSVAVIRSWTLRSISIFCLIALPYTAYYSTMPKPEPVQLLFLSIFLLFYFRDNFRFGISWIWLGLSVGAKISLLPALPAIFALSMAKEFMTNTRVAMKTIFVKKVALAFFWFAVGMCLAVPILFQGKIKTYLQWTLFGTGHGQDSSLITWRDWLAQSAHDYSASPLIFSAFLFVVIACYGIAIKKNIIEVVKLGGSSFLNRSLVTLALSFVLVSSIMLFAKRIWGFYLHPGAVLATVSAIAAIELPQFNRTKNFIMPALILIFIFFGYLEVRIAKTAQEFRDLATRTKSPLHQELQEKYLFSLQVINKLSDSSEKPVRVDYDPLLFTPENSEKLFINNFYGPYVGWVNGPDLVISNSAPLEKESSNLPATDAASFASAIKAHQMFKDHVVFNVGTCVVKPCYRRYCSAPRGLEIYAKVHEDQESVGHNCISF